MKEQLGPQHEVRGTDQAQLPDQRHEDGAREPAAREERDVTEPVPDVRHAPV